MYQKWNSMQKGVVAVAFAMAFAPAIAPAKTPEKCRRTIVKAAQGFAAAKASALRKCEDGVLKGKVVGPCPDAKNATAIAKAASKLVGGINKQCGELTVADTGFEANCPRAACLGANDTIADVAECVACNTGAMVDKLIAQSYGTLRSPSSAKATLACQRTYGKEIVGAFSKIAKVFAKCEDGVIKGKIPPGTCPDAKGAASISKIVTGLNGKISKKCPDAATQAAAINVGAAFGALGGVSNAGARVTDIAQTQVKFSLNSEICGDASIDAGETCDDGNRSGDVGTGAADTCPATCVIAACNVSGAGNATVNITSPNGEVITAATILLYYNDAKLRVPGSNNDAQVQAAVQGAGFFSVTAFDTNYALRAVAIDATLTGETSGPVLTIDYEQCGAAAIPGDFNCFVVDAADDNFSSVDGVTCSVVP